MFFKNNKLNKVISIVSLFILISITSINIKTKAAINIFDDSIDEAISYQYQPTIDDNFEDDKVIVTLKKQYSDINKVFNLNDFTTENIITINDMSNSNQTFDNNELRFDSKVILESLSDLTHMDDPSMISNPDNFSQILSITLYNKSKENVLNAINEFKNLKIVLDAEPSYIYEKIDLWSPDDTDYSNQWGLNYINIEGAWNFVNSNVKTSIKVGIFEENIQFDHPDLNVVMGSFTPSSTANADHGTHVGGIIGATANNKRGVSGVAQVDLVLLNRNNFVNSIVWAINNKVRVINASFCFGRRDNKNNLILSGPETSHAKALEDFGNAGGIFIAAAGNSGGTNLENTDNTPFYPAGYGDARNYPNIHNVISVGSINRLGKKSSFSNYGTNSVHIYAPGSDILSTFPENRWGTNVANYDQTSRGYAITSGTSMAAPYVSGVAALMLSINPNITAEGLRNAILNNADTITIRVPNSAGSTSYVSQSVRSLNALKAVASVAFKTSSNDTGITIEGLVAYYNFPENTYLVLPDGFTPYGSTLGSSHQNIIGIGTSSFANKINLKSIIIPNTVTHIDPSAFEGCSNLQTVTLSNNLTSIGSSAFKSCTSLSSITIPNRVTSIGYAAFEGCYNLQNITLPFVGGAEEDEDINYFGYIFGANTYYENNYYVPTNLKNVVLTVCTKIGSFSFYNCRRLESIAIPNGIESIGSSAFKNCTSLTSIRVPGTVTIIDSNAFEGCTGLTSITLQNGLTSIGSFAFKGCWNITSIRVPGTVTIIDFNAFEGCTGLTSITLQNGLTSIGSFAFKGCWNIIGIRVPSTVISIYSNAFEGCTGLTSITLQNGLTSIGSSAFKNCTSLPSISVPSTVKNIDSNAFEGCTSVTSITLQNGLESIGSFAFKGCMNITSISVPSTVINIDSSAFEGCIRLQTLTLSNDLTSIGSSAFKGCRNLSNLTIPDSVEQIGNEAFMDCLYLETVIVERTIATITTLGENAFSGCSNTLEIIVPINRIAEYRNNWSSYRNKITTRDEYQELDIDCESNLNSSISLNAGYNKLYKLNVNCSKSYMINALTSNTITIIIYNEDMNVIDNSSNLANIFLSCGTYYLSLEFTDITTSGSIETNISLRWPNSDIQLLYGTNNIKANFHNITGNMSHGKFYYINNKGTGFFKFKLNAGNNTSYPEGAITIYDSQRTKILDRYSIDSESNPAVSNVGENEMYIYLPKNGYYYIDIVLPTSSYTTITFTIEEAEKQNINYLNRLDSIGFDEIFFNQTSTNYFKEVTISHRSKIELDIQTTGGVNENIPVYILEKQRDSGYEPGVDYYYIVPKLIEEITKTNRGPVFSMILDPGTYYIGYLDNVDHIGIQFALRRKVNTDLNIGGTLVTDSAYNQGFELGTEVTFNNGELLGNTITKGFTRNIYLMVEDRLKDSMSRLEYDWYSSNESAAKVTKYGTVLGMNVTEDTLVKIYAINKVDPSIVYSINLTIVDNTSFEEIVIESNMTYSYSRDNGTYQLELDFTNCPYPYIQYYSWNIYPEDPIQVSIDYWGQITSSGVGEVTIIGSYDLNIRITIIIHLTIIE